MKIAVSLAVCTEIMVLLLSTGRVDVYGPLTPPPHRLRPQGHPLSLSLHTATEILAFDMASSPNQLSNKTIPPLKLSKKKKKMILLTILRQPILILISRKQLYQKINI
ncbi:hypothetical protein QTP88_012801 [Uroleucon formosanum]